MMLGSHTRFWVPNKSGKEVQGSIRHGIKEGCRSSQAAALCPVWACMVILLPLPESYYHPSNEKPEALRKAKKGERKDWGCNLVDNVLA